MADMIGLLRFGMPVTPATPTQQAEPTATRVTTAVSGVQSSSGSGQTSANYSALPRPVVSPQFAYANMPDDAGAESAAPEPFDINVIPGPPPTFEATLLELEAHLRMSLSRIDANRNAKPLEPKPTPDRAEGSEKSASPDSSAPTIDRAEPAQSDRPTGSTGRNGDATRTDHDAATRQSQASAVQPTGPWEPMAASHLRRSGEPAGKAA